MLGLTIQGLGFPWLFDLYSGSSQHSLVAVESPRCLEARNGMPAQGLGFRV